MENIFSKWACWAVVWSMERLLKNTVYYWDPNSTRVSAPPGNLVLPFGMLTSIVQSGWFKSSPLLSKHPRLPPWRGPQRWHSIQFHSTSNNHQNSIDRLPIMCKFTVSGTLLVSWGCLTKYHRLDGVHNRHFVPHGAGGQKPKFKGGSFWRR